MASPQEIGQETAPAENKDNQRCEGCHVWGAEHIQHERPDWMSETTSDDSLGCLGCQVFGAEHTHEGPALWANPMERSMLQGDEQPLSDSSSDTPTQQSYLESLTRFQESLVLSQIDEEDEVEEHGRREEEEARHSIVENEASSTSYTTAMTTQPERVEDHFTVLIRLPFNRGDFVDPPPVKWSAAKESALWDILSRQNNSQIDWKALAERFEVTQNFLLSKAAWLYERQLSQVRAQMRRVGTRNSVTPSPTPGSVSGSMVGGQTMRRAGSGGSRVPSRLSTRQAGSPTTGGGDSTPGTPVKSRVSLPLRSAPTPVAGGAVPQTRAVSGSSRPLSRQSSRDVDAPIPASQSRRGSIQHQLARSPGQVRTTQPESSSSEDEMTQSRITNRRLNPSSLHRRALSYRTDTQPQRGPANKADERGPAQQQGADDNDDEDDEPSFLPFANPPTEGRSRPSSSSQQDPSATLRGAIQTQRPGIHRRATSERVVSSPTVEPPTPVQTQRTAHDLTSSTSSLSSPTNPTGTRPALPRPSSAADAQALPTRTQSQSTVPRLGTPLSPSHRALLPSNQPPTAASPRRGPGSDSASPSMGSSFSDLDDASVTQSALEEALLSGMGNTTMTNLGGFGGRVTSGIGQALRSRYFDARGEGQGQGRNGNGGQGGVSER
ncbi:hypothetical protein H2200_006691 [Cladophialophora chaetospira]|uniref:Autophagy-related protein 29 n=1 Tax=Cladophialophora chaetospira TaxID=386627 RepID=A0AA38X8U0_9EURO|nr:hypothetical protein H2200_006691 [Cladophialophora chaetospira]